MAPYSPNGPEMAHTSDRRQAAPRTGQRLVVLDLLRFAAAASVMCFHFTGVADERMWGQDPRGLFPEMAWARFGSFGVQLFFVISGFVILMSAWGRRPGDFAVSRITRLFPAYWFAVTLAVAVYAATGLEHGYGPKAPGVYERFLPNLTMLQGGIGVPHMEGLYWTLWVELHFYALIALLVWRGITYGRCIGFMTFWLLGSLFAKEADSDLFQALLVPQYAPYFIGGMALYLIYAHGHNLLTWLFVGAGWALGTYYAQAGVNRRLYWEGVHEVVVPAVITAIFVVMALVATHRLDWIRWKRLTTLGALTYPLYLVHLTVFRPVQHYLWPGTNRLVVLAACVGTALISAYLVYRLVERPGARLLGRALRRAVAQIRALSVPPEPPEPAPPAGGVAVTAQERALATAEAGRPTG